MEKDEIKKNMATCCTNLEQKKKDVKGMCMGDMKEYEVIVKN